MVAMRIRLPKLSIEYYDPGVLRKVGNAIGPVLQVNLNTTSEVRGRFTRICIQVNLDKPLITSILLKGVVQEVLYEDINTLCFSCGWVGHRQEGCLYTIKEMEQAPVANGEVNFASKKNETNVVIGDCSQKVGEVEDDLKDDGKDDGKDAYGPWLLVRRKKARPKT